MASARWSAATALALLAVVGLAVSCARGPGTPGGIDPELEVAIADIEAGRRTTPLVEQLKPGDDAAVTFLVESRDGTVPRIVSDVTGWGESPDDSDFDLTVGTMTRVGSTDWYRLEARVAARTRIEYLIVHVPTDYRVDQHNPRRAWSRDLDPISEFVAPDFEPPQELTDPHVTPRGKTIEASIDSRALGGSRRVLVYLPPGYRDDGALPVAVFHSGWGVAREGQAPRVLDWLIAHRRIEPLVAVFLDSYLPGVPDNHEGLPMRSFLTREVPAWVRSHSSVSANADEWAVLAISYGAKDALDAAVSPAETYGRLGLLIPGRRLQPADLDDFARSGHRRLCVTILAGRYDAANLATAEYARQALANAGHDVDYLEVPEGHNPATWRNHMGDVLVSLFGERDAPTPREFRAYARSKGPEPDLSGVRLYPELPELEVDRRVSAVLEIDRAEGLPELPLTAPTRQGPVDLKQILGDVGIDLEIVWSDTLPGEALVDEPWPGTERFRALMARHRNVQPQGERWQLYLILARKTSPNRELSMLLDPETRLGAIVFIDPDDRRGTLHAIGHEIGHLLNLVHPWELYGNTRSLMSYPWRWQDWDWSDPAVFRFDEPGRRHIRRAPGAFVRPGGGGFTDSGSG